MSETTTGRRPSDNPTVLRPIGEWRTLGPGVYRCMVYLTPEAEGGFSVEAATLPGVASQGNNEKEALANIAEALEGAFAAYRDLGTKIPWLTMPRERPSTAKEKWVIVHA